jgi:apolipoprotein N-acyltransferase
VIQIAAATGVYGISFLLACVNAAAAEVVWKLMRRRRIGAREWRGVGVAAGALGLVLGFGAYALRTEAPAPAAAVPIAIAQGNLSGAERWDARGPARTLDVYLRLTLDAFARGRPAIVFWPEASLTFFLESEDLYRQLIGATLHRHDAELVLGAPRAAGPDGSAPYANSVYLMSSDGTLRARYDKQYLLPFMEYLPLRFDMARRRFGRIREFTPGGATPPLPTRAGPAGVLVCNEALLPQMATRRMAEGAAYLLNPSNDSWVPDAGFARQQFDIAALRAVEQRAYLVRASDSGPSGVVDPVGRVVAETAPLTRDVLLATIAPATGPSLYGRVGDAFGGLCCLATALALLRRDRL